MPVAASSFKLCSSGPFSLPPMLRDVNVKSGTGREDPSEPMNLERKFRLLIDARDS